ncbi:hypothetical protein EMPS_07527 [Entomortierella parvispora]|uniref:P-loop containing nucleoside triphosphate hydrolase protein n=1 Tax=Entomortierella parvispora TaxID=205924 RepID=A0A9P3HEC5_9FUNG|nr:hypothetical protein EMPS_07527 [Entomortierella parvispora]
MMVWMSIRVMFLFKTGAPHNLGRTAWIYWPTQVAMGSTGLLSIILASLMQRRVLSNQSPAATIGYSLFGCLWLLSLLCNAQEHKYRVRSSTVIFVSYVVFVPVLAVHTRTLLMLSSDNTLELSLNTTMLGLLAFGFVVEAWPRGSTVVQRSSHLPAYDKANVFMQISFFFWQPVLSLSVKRTLTQDDLAGTLPYDISTSYSYERFEYFWKRAVNRAKSVNERNRRKLQGSGRAEKKEITPSLFRMALRSLLVYLPALFFFRLARVLAAFSVPAILSSFLAYLQSIQASETIGGDKTNEPSLAYGLLLVFGMFLGSFMTAILTYSSRQHCIKIGMQIRAALISAVYRKALCLSAGSRGQSTTGEITNLMATDADKWGDCIIYLNMWLSVPMEISVGLWLLFRLLGWSAWAGILTMLALTPLQVWRAKYFGKIESKNLAKMDDRIRLTTEVLTAIKVVKLYCWESAFMDKILAIREEGLAIARHMGVIFAIMSILFASSTLIICLATLSVYATWGGPGFTPGELTPQTVFVSMTLFAMLRVPISSMTEATTNTVSLLVACKRLQTFLLREEVDPSDIIREPDVTLRHASEPMIVMENATFSWSSPPTSNDNEEQEEDDETTELLNSSSSGEVHSHKATLDNITLAFDKGTLVAVVGRVGQGKSSLVSAIIGEMYKWGGHVKTFGRIAYVPQQAWILNATLKDNILFGKPYDQEKYQRIITACGLLPDIEMLPAGSETEIGERGINLSGGQKQRVSLARSAYDDADIYLLDDPLSAVDAHVDQHLWNELIGPQGLLSSKTRILVTHGIHHLRDVDKVVVLKDGKVVEQGHYEELMGARLAFYQLICEYSVPHRSSSSASSIAASSDGSGTGEDDTITDHEGSNSQGDDTGTKKAPGEPSKKSPAKKDTNAKLIAAEKAKAGRIDLNVVKAYGSAFSYANMTAMIVFLLLAQVCLIGVNLWLKHWINLGEQDKERPSLRFFLSIFALLTVLYSLANVGVIWIAFVVGRIRASRVLHKNLLSRVMRLPCAFFDTTPLGRVLNRFSSDMHSIDERITWKLSDSLAQASNILSSLIVMAVVMPQFLLALPFFLLAFYFLLMYYINSSRDGKRIFTITKSPIFQHFTETLGGVSTIRAMRLEDRFIEANAVRSDVHSNAYLAYGYTIQWMGVQTQLLSASIILVASLCFVLAPRGSVDASAAGLAMSFAMTIAQGLGFFVRSTCDMQNQLIAVERIMELTELNTEAALRTEPDSLTGRALENQRREGRPWPQKGEIVFENYSTRYREGLDLVLRNVSFTAEAGKRVGIVGRTGAGKSSLTLALFRMIEAANSPPARACDNTGRVTEYEDGEEEETGGKITIDGLDISQMGLADLREQLAIIPQEPVLFAGTVRENLDPFGQIDDAALWQALERAHLKDFILSLNPTGEDGGEGGLSFRVAQQGENFSVGQRSLLCLARALLRKTKVLILDEATSAVDVETDELIQQTIRKEFADRTVLTIAHRIKTVMDSDKILVLDHGSVVEYDAPSALVQRPESLFYKLAQQAGEL